MPVTDDSLCVQTENAGEVSKSSGACCYVATVDNVNLLTGELTITFTGTQPEGLSSQVIVPGANVRYNCGLCYTGGLGTNLPAFGFERADSVLCIISHGPVDTALQRLFVVGHEFAAGVGDLKTCGQTDFLFLNPAKTTIPYISYVSPYLQETVVDGVPVCLPINPFFDPHLFEEAAMGTISATLTGSPVMVYAGDPPVCLRPYMIPNGAAYIGLASNAMTGENKFDSGIRVVASSYSNGTYCSIYWGAQTPRQIGTSSVWGSGSIDLTALSLANVGLRTKSVNGVPNGTLCHDDGRFLVCDPNSSTFAFNQTYNDITNSISYDVNDYTETANLVTDITATGSSVSHVDVSYIMNQHISHSIPFVRCNTATTEYNYSYSDGPVKLWPVSSGPGIEVNVSGSSTVDVETQDFYYILGHVYPQQIYLKQSNYEEYTEEYAFDGVVLGQNRWSKTLSFDQSRAVGDCDLSAWAAYCSGAGPIPSYPYGGSVVMPWNESIEGNLITFLYVDAEAGIAVYLDFSVSMSRSGTQTALDWYGHWGTWPEALYSVTVVPKVYINGTVHSGASHSYQVNGGATGAVSGVFVLNMPVFGVSLDPITSDPPVLDYDAALCTVNVADGDSTSGGTESFLPTELISYALNLISWVITEELSSTIYIGLANMNLPFIWNYSSPYRNPYARAIAKSAEGNMVHVEFGLPEQGGVIEHIHIYDGNVIFDHGESLSTGTGFPIDSNWKSVV